MITKKSADISGRSVSEKEGSVHCHCRRRVARRCLLGNTNVLRGGIVSVILQVENLCGDFD